MAKVINFVDFKKKFKDEEKLKEIQDTYANAKENYTISVEDNKNNYNFLVNNYENIYKRLKNGCLNIEEFNLFYKKLCECISLCNDKGEILYEMLLFYNLFRLYDEDLLKKDSTDIHTLISGLIAFDDVNIKLLDKALDFCFCSDKFNILKEISNDKKDLENNIIDVIDLYLDDLNKKNMPSIYHANYIIEELDNRKYIDNEDVILDVNKIYNILNRQFELFVNVAKLNNSTYYDDMISIIQDGLNNYYGKYAALSSENKLNFISYTSSILNKSGTSLLEKFNYIFGYQNKLLLENKSLNSK